MKKMSNTKKMRNLILALATVLVFTATAGFSAEAKAATNYTIHFETDGGTTVDDLTVEAGGFIWRPENPQKEGYIFVDWYVDKKLTKLFDFDLGATASITLYAKWIKIGESQHFKKGIVYASGDTVNFGKDYVFINNGEEKLKIKGTLVFDDFNFNETYIRFWMYPTQDSSLMYYGKGWEGMGWYDANTIDTILKGKNGVGFVVKDGDGTEESPYKLEISYTKKSETIEEDAEIPYLGTMIKKLKITQGTKLTVSWGKIKKAASYEVYASYDGTSFSEKPTATVKKSKVSLKKINKKKVSFKKIIILKVVAKDKNGKELDKFTIFIVGKKHPNYTEEYNWDVAG